MPPASRIRFGPFEVDSHTGELWKLGQPIKLAPKPLRVLTLLAGSPGQLFTREALRQQLWGNNTFVDFEHGLNFCIRRIRSALNDSATNPRYIETLPRRGYRFIPEASPGDQQLPLRESNSGASAAEAPQIEAYEFYTRARRSFGRVGKEALEEARQDFERALALHPNYAMAHSGLGATYSLRFLNRRDPADIEKAEAYLQRALELDPEIAEPYPWLCYVHMRRGDIDRALHAGHRGVQLQPDLAHAHYFLGLAYFSFSESDPANYQPAVDHLLSATRVGPRWQPSWFVLSYAALLNGHYESAVVFANRLLAGGDGLPFIGAEIVLASVELRQRNADAARHLILGFLERMNTSDHMYRDSMSAVAACVLGDLEMREGRTSEALTAYRRAWHAVQEHPRMAALQRISARVQAGLASAYAAGGEQGRALELLSKAVHTTGESISPAHNAAAASLPDLYWGIAAALVRTGDLEQGLRMLEAAVRTGWRDSAWLCGDPEFEALRSKPGFAALIKAIRRGPGINFVAY